MDVGFIGLGTMGRPMAFNVAKAGHRIFGQDALGVPEELTVAGAVACESARAVAERAEAVILMLPDTPDVEAALFGADGVAEGLGGGKLVIDMSSISPTATARFAERIRGLGSDYVDAPVSGGPTGAVAGSLTIMVGGPEAAFDRARPLLECMGATITLIGTKNGDGQVCKAANQIIVGATIEAVAEALVFAAKAGTDPAKVHKALMGGAAASPILENHGGRMLARNFAPAFRAELQQKDLNVALSAARELGVMLPGTAAAEAVYNAVRARGEAGDDHISVLKVLEGLADTRVEGGAAEID